MDKNNALILLCLVIISFAVLRWVYMAYMVYMTDEQQQHNYTVTMKTMTINTSIQILYILVDFS